MFRWNVRRATVDQGKPEFSPEEKKCRPPLLPGATAVLVTPISLVLYNTRRCGAVHNTVTRAVAQEGTRRVSCIIFFCIYGKFCYRNTMKLVNSWFLLIFYVMLFRLNCIRAQHKHAAEFNLDR